MKFLLLSDLQGVMYHDWQNFMQMNTEDIDVVATMGDIDTLFLKSISEKFADKPRIGVLGNHDYKGDLEYFNLQNIHNKPIRLNDMTIVGLEGCVRYKSEKDAPLHTQEEIHQICSVLPPCEIVFSHNSPYLIHDKDDLAHEGYTGLRDYIDKHQPSYVFHGHQHINNITQYNSTTVIGIYGGWIWDTESDSLKQVLSVID